MRKNNNMKSQLVMMSALVVIGLVILVSSISKTDEKTIAPNPMPMPTPMPRQLEQVPRSAQQLIPDAKDVELLARLIHGEAGDQSKDCMLAVGAVVLNRVKHERYPNTLEKVIFQRNQYACTWDGNFERTPSEQAYEVSYWLLENELKERPMRVLPDNVIYQAQFKQGQGVYRKIGTEVFCYEGEEPSCEECLL